MPNLACGCVPSPVCSVCVLVLLLPVGRGIAGPCFTCGAHNLAGMIGEHVPPSSVTSDPCQVPCWVWQEVKGETIAVNKADYTSVIVWTVGPNKGVKWEWL